MEEKDLEDEEEVKEMVWWEKDCLENEDEEEWMEEGWRRRSWRVRMGKGRRW